MWFERHYSRQNSLIGTVRPWFGPALAGLALLAATTAPSPAQPTFKSLYTFSGGTDGTDPTGLLADSAGNLFGFSDEGGQYGDGTVFELTPPALGGAAWTYTKIGDFDGGGTTGAAGNIVMDEAGSIYGTRDDYIFKLSVPTVEHPSWTPKILSSYSAAVCGRSDCGFSGLVRARSGELYALSRGNIDGNVIKLSPPRAGQKDWTTTILYQFYGSDGSLPSALAIDPSGGLVGATSGVVDNPHELDGTVFRLQPPATAGADWRFTVLHQFPNASAEGPNSLAFDSTGTLYGTTIGGGNAKCNCGTVFKLAPVKGQSTWRETVIHRFSGYLSFPTSNALTIDTAGALYVSVSSGKAGGGLAKLAPPAAGLTQWTYSVLEAGRSPYGPVAITSSGTIYGVTQSGGIKFNGFNACPAAGCGLVYQITQ